MSGCGITMHEYIAALREHIPAELHPMAHTHIHEWLDQLEVTADVVTIHRLLHRVHDKISDELAWEAEKLRSADELMYEAYEAAHD